MNTAWIVFAVSTFWASIACFPHDANSGKPTPSENFPYYKVLDTNSKYHLFWKFNQTHITFETHVKTHGFVGFGMSTNGKMFPADVVTGWVKDGIAYLQDRHTLGHFPPIIDASQDWFLLHGEENDFGTVLKMVRKLDTCDDQDFKITEDTVRVIYAYSSVDPPSENGIPYHGVNQRGSKSLMLLSELKTPDIPADAMTRDLLNGNYSVPGQYTTYHCTIFDFSELQRKHHMVQFDPVVQKGHEVLIHHIVLYRCPGIEKSYVGSDYECYETPNKKLHPCGNVFLGWAVGGDTFYFPEDVGMPLGDPTDDAVYILETHYNNPEMRSDFVDSSGMKITYTPTLRRHDAGLLAAGIVTHPFVVIPPHEKAFVVPSICTKECLNKGLKSRPDGINVFAAWQHGHLLAEGIKTRHIRNGVEQEPLAYDEHYDFDYQDYRHLHKPRSIQAGDSLIVECTYDSTTRTNVTHGGLSTLDEMCLSFLYYYPRMDVELCQTLPMYNSTDINDYRNIINFYNVDYNDPANRQMFKEIVADSNYLELCFITGSTQPIQTVTKIPAPRVAYTSSSPCNHPAVNATSPPKGSLSNLDPLG